MDRLTECKYKCSYTFNYNLSNLNMSHKGSYIQINYDKSSGKQVVYNNNPYSVYEIRLYKKPITIIGDQVNSTTSENQLVIFHSSNTSSLNLIVIVPIIRNNYLGTSLLNDIVVEATNNLNVKGDTHNSRMDGFTLEKIVPKSPFMAYTARADFGDGKMSTKYNFVEFDSKKQGYISLYKEYFDELETLLSPYTIVAVVNSVAEAGTMAYNKIGPTEISDSNEIYIDCQPIYDNTVKKENVIFKGVDKKIKKVNKYTKFIFGLIFPLIITILVFIGLYNGFQKLVGRPPTEDHRISNSGVATNS